ncbi:Retrovirus-related Pol polyprotein from transposon TNT 1-94 [Sesamum alatum]|uniref:Retrovirus-related Pol polyprotein from transposon TNT 1-94 n=1 Tax=Sesamum alatum TaxID=300844 RepID=A0AAE2CHW9_9LAMI|nr:Retrovirus-related Pol polyprotein from transposon TNT 1-94 [Sesamum alatum]
MDSSSSSHMTVNSEVFISLDRSAKTCIKMANGTICNTEGKGVIKLNSGEDFTGVVFNNKTKNNLLLKVPISRNNMVPLVINDEKKALATSLEDETWLWHNSPTSALTHQTPFEAFHERKPKVTHLKVFGCVAHVLIPSQKRSKLDENSVKCIFVGYSFETKGYRFYNPETNKLLISCDVVFDDKSSWEWNKMRINEAIIQEDVGFTNLETLEGDENSYSSTPDSTLNSLRPALASSSSSSTPPRKWRLLTDIYEQKERCQLVQIAEPSSFNEAVQSVAWCDAMDDEMKALENNKTWELVNCQRERKSSASKSIYKLKANSIQKHKAKEGITFSSVVNLILFGFYQLFQNQFDVMYKCRPALNYVKTKGKH